MEVILGILITSLFWAVCFFLYLSEKNKHDALKAHEENRRLRGEQNTIYLPNNNNNEIQRLKELLNDKEEKISSLSSLYAKLRKTLNDMEEQISEKDYEILRLKNSLSEKENRLNSSLLNSQTKKEIERLNTVIRAKEAEIRRFSHQQDLNDEEIHKLNKLLREKDAEIKRLEDQLLYTAQSENPGLNSTLRNEVSRLRSILCKREEDVVRLQNSINEKDNEILRLLKEKTSSPSSSPTGKRFISVKFYKNSPDKFDYFMGKITDLKIGDYVMVPVKGILKPATVCYISKPGEISKYARSEIVSKIDKREQISLFD